MLSQNSGRLQKLPDPVSELAHELAGMPGVVAVALGGSRALGSDAPDSDWDLGVYYRDGLEPKALAARGKLHPPGAWGRLMNGGAWLDLDGLRVDVLLRDLGQVEAWQAQAVQGAFEVDLLLGYLAGIPTYSLCAELAINLCLFGELPAAPFPPQLQASAPTNWRFRRDFSLMYAHKHARRGQLAALSGQVAKAAMEEAHARLCERGEWVLNEKHLLMRADLEDINAAFARLPAEAVALEAWLDGIAATLGARPMQL